MGRAFWTLFLATLIVGLSSRPALAGVQWCEQDPVVVINGTPVDIVSKLPYAEIPNVSGSVLFHVELPANTLLATAIVLPAQLPQEVRITRSLPAWSGLGQMPAVVHVTVRATTDFETRTTVTGTTWWGGKLKLSATTVGRSNSTTTIKFTLPAL
jgi:hypothetical protein